MTQLLLFDACSVPSPVAPGLHRTAAVASASLPAASNRSHSNDGDGSRAIPLYDPHQGELHRMGDLAQLVLARYDLLAQRRAAMRARRR